MPDFKHLIGGKDIFLLSKPGHPQDGVLLTLTGVKAALALGTFDKSCLHTCPDHACITWGDSTYFVQLSTVFTGK